MPARARRGRWRNVAFFLLANIAILLLVEGLASTMVVGQLASGLVRPLAERVHTQADPDLGWVSIPNLSLPDRYGPGVGLTTNAQGFRHEGDVAPRVPAGKARVICTGDSFAFGPGVSNADTWCDIAGRIDPRLETVNMGQVGYGADQAFLWYRRDAAGLDQDVHVFSFIADDLERMRYRSILSYGKPVLTLEGGALAVTNVPVPFRSTLRVRLDSAAWLLSNFRAAQVIRWLLRTDEAAGPQPGGAGALQDVVAGMFDALESLHAERGSAAVLVFLPVREDYDGRVSEGWRSFVREAARDRLPLIDLVADLRAVPPGEVDSLFLQPGDSPDALAAGHYSAQGHEFIARALYRRLMALPLVRARVTAPDRRE